MLMQNSQYNSRVEKNKHMIENLNNYMLTNKNLITYLNDCLLSEKVNKTKKIEFRKNNQNQSLFFPYQDDKLFWLFYIMLNGIENYKLLGEHTYQVEKEEKMNFIKQLQKNKILIKELKLKKSDCENDLINEKKISIHTFNLLCNLNNINFIFIFKNIYYISDPSENPTFIIHKVNDLYGYEPFNENIYEASKTNRYEISSLNKPIKAISNFKIDELKIIAENLHILLLDEKQKAKNKISLYDEIKDVLSKNLD